MATTQQQKNTGEPNLLQAIDMVARDKGIDKARLVKTVEEAILKAAQSVFGPTRELEARFNEETGQVDLFQYMTVVDDPSDDEREIALEVAQAAGLDAELGEELGFQIFWHPSDAKKAAQQDKDFGDILMVKQAGSTFGRIAAQTAKQVLIQRVRDEERDPSTTSSRTRRASSSRASSAASRRGRTSSSTSVARRASSRSASRRPASRTARVIASSPSSRTSIVRRAARRSSCRASSVRSR